MTSRFDWTIANFDRELSRAGGTLQSPSTIQFYDPNVRIYVNRLYRYAGYPDLTLKIFKITDKFDKQWIRIELRGCNDLASPIFLKLEGKISIVGENGVKRITKEGSGNFHGYAFSYDGSIHIPYSWILNSDSGLLHQNGSLTVRCKMNIILSWMDEKQEGISSLKYLAEQALAPNPSSSIESVANLISISRQYNAAHLELVCKNYFQEKCIKQHNKNNKRRSKDDLDGIGTRKRWKNWWIGKVSHIVLCYALCYYGMCTCLCDCFCEE